MYKVQGIKKQFVECEIRPKQVAYILQEEYSNILGCSYGSLLFGEFKKQGNSIIRKRDNSVFKVLTKEELKYANALKITMEYLTKKENE